MKLGFLRKIKGLKTIALIMAGGASSVVFPPFVDATWGFLFLIAFLGYLLVPLRTKKNLFFNAYVFGMAFYGAGFSWINNALLIDNDKLINFIPLVVAAIGLFFGLFWALPAVFAGWGKNVPARMFLFCGAYVFFEWIRSFIFTGFPWNLMGTALCFSPYLISGASFIGTYGLSLLLMLGLCGIVLVVGVKRYRKLGTLMLVVCSLIFGLFSLQYDKNQAESTDVVRLVQPNIAQTFKWDRGEIYKNFRQHIDMSKTDEKIKLVVWGETATPYYLDRDVEKLREVQEAVPEGGFLITGVLRVGIDAGQYLHYNSMFVIDDKGVIKDYYDKSHLVPFGEFLPFREYLPDFMSPVADIVGELGRGEKYKNVDVKGLPLMGAAICYESIFPHEILNSERKPEILVVLANDGWYGISNGPYQHLAAAQMRAVEEGVTVIRSANTGISAVIDYNGVIRGKIGLDKKGVVDVKLPLKLEKKTFYGTFGNIIPLGLVVIVLLLGLWFNSLLGCVKSIKM